MIKLIGVRNIVTEARNNLGTNNNLYLQINVDKSTGKVWSDLHCSIGQNSWNVYSDSDIITVCNISDSSITMADLKAMVERKINEQN